MIYLSVQLTYPRRSHLIQKFHELEFDIAKLSKDSCIILAGGLITRTDYLLDFIHSGNFHHIPGDNIPSHFDIKGSKNFDSHINEQGNALLDICKTFESRVLKDRTKGKITFHLSDSSQGISTAC